MLKNKINFTKLVASGNDFILWDLRKKAKDTNLKNVARLLCSRKLGIGADGLLVLEKSRKANVKMRIFNADGSEAEMCGNGARCVAYFISNIKTESRRQIKIDTKAGVLSAVVSRENVKINMTDPKNIKINSTIRIKKHSLKFNFINTGVPHVVILCEGIEGIKVSSLGRLVRFHNSFKPAGTNVNFVEPVSADKIKIRTYERGVEEETLACGTGSVASAIIYMLKLIKSGLIKNKNIFKVNVETASSEVLKVNFEIIRNKIKNVWLEGKTRIICKGEFYV
ncbi:MAG: diaminopimelate epimerase [Candidatus Omnitrophota bacterium]